MQNSNITATTISVELVTELTTLHGRALEVMQADVSAMFWALSAKNPDADESKTTVYAECLKTLLKWCEAQHGIAIKKVDDFMTLAVVGKLSISKGNITFKESTYKGKRATWLQVTERFQPTKRQCQLLWNPPKADDADETPVFYTVDDIVKAALKRIETMSADLVNGVTLDAALAGIEVGIRNALRDKSAALELAAYTAETDAETLQEVIKENEAYAEDAQRNNMAIAAG